MFSDLTVTRRFRFCDPLQTSEPHINYDGFPFLILWKKIMECHQGPYKDLAHGTHQKEKAELYRNMSGICVLILSKIEIDL